MQQTIDFINSHAIGSVVIAFFLGIGVTALAIWAITQENDNDDFHLPPNRSQWN
ncbi:hypothetical protein QQ054_31930 [Oscillatoria amoena NRMC-F 0135]|nr:hypothetical protein [Oscillatoria amoena NRMC-F 0135]